MATFTGTDASDSIQPSSVSAGVVTDPAGAVPSSADDVINAGGGNDAVQGGGGFDQVDLGDGDDSYVRAVAGGIDRLSGGAGFDTLSLVGVD